MQFLIPRLPCNCTSHYKLQTWSHQVYSTCESQDQARVNCTLQSVYCITITIRLWTFLTFLLMYCLYVSWHLNCTKKHTAIYFSPCESLIARQKVITTNYLSMKRWTRVMVPAHPLRTQKTDWFLLMAHRFPQQSRINCWIKSCYPSEYNPPDKETAFLTVVTHVDQYFSGHRRF